MGKITRLRIFMVAAFILSIFCFVSGITELVNRNKPREDLYNLEDFTFTNGQYITAEIDFVWDNFAEVTNETRVYGIKTSESDFSQIYLIDCYDKSGEHRLICAEVVHKDDIAAFNEIENNSWFEGEEAIFSKSFAFDGRVTKTDSDIVEFAYEAMIGYEWITNRTEFDELFLPFTVRVLSGTAYDPMVSFGIGVLLLFGGAAMLIIDILKRRKYADELALFEVYAASEAVKAETGASQSVSSTENPQTHSDDNAKKVSEEMLSVPTMPDISKLPESPTTSTSESEQPNTQDKKTDDFTLI
ncbi:MAG: hypothetical protein LBM87_03840 [Ruminococcus sp.]|nr:hypothetical protein [Ruminococcus sp.]